MDTIVSTKKNIWIVCVNAQPPEYDTHLRHYIFAQKLVKNGYNVTIFGGSVMHYKNINLIQDNTPFICRKYDGVSYVFFKTLRYQNSSIKRIWGIFFFSIKLYLNRKKFTRPDIVIHNLRVPFDFFVYHTARKLKAKYVTEVWDLWPESFTAFGLVKKYNPFISIAYKVEKYLYTKSDAMIFTMEGAFEYLADKKWRLEDGGTINMQKFNYINNGISLSKFNEDKMTYTIDDEDLLNKELFKVVYLGSISYANNLMLLIKAAEKLQDIKNIVFLIYGDGSDRELLINYCEKNSIKNVFFKERWVDIKYVPFILSNSSLNILNYRPNTIFRYGGSQGKLFQYLASGKPICSNLEMCYDIVKKYNAGIISESSNPDDYAKAIIKIYIMNDYEYNILCQNALKAANEFDLGLLFDKFFNIIKTL